ncbi:hypothetical protein C0995_011932 [Termitomyces sp. Mi166|nr:hypothetical protein C0995_011932 [Termitomyces sp. Mi166\
MPRVSSISIPDAIHFVRRLRTVLIPGTGVVHSQTVPRLHKSFFEYITGDHVDIRFRVDIGTSHRELGICCLYQVALVRSTITSFKMPHVFRYATRFWSHHLSSSGLTSGILITDLNQNFHDIENLLQFSSAKLVLPPTGISVSGSSVAVSILGRTCAWDVGSGLVQDGISFNEIASVKLPEVIPDQLTKSQPSLRPLPAWTSSSGDTIDGGHFTEARDGVIHIWNIDTKVSEVRSLNFYEETGKWKNHISCIALSLSAQTLAAGCDDGTIHFWNLRHDPARLISSSSLPSEFDKIKPITMLVLSPDGTKALSCSERDIDITVWTLFDRELHHTLLICTGTAAPRSLAFSPDSGTVLSGHSDGTICIWDVRSRELTGSPIALSHPKEAISAICFSNDGESIICGSQSGRLDIWNAETRQLVASFYGIDSAIGTICSFPTQDHQLCISGISELKFLEVQGKFNNLKLNDGRMIVASSLSSARVVALSQNNTICVWDAVTGELIAESQKDDTATLSTFTSRKVRDAAMFFSPEHGLVTMKRGRFLLWEIKTDGKLSCSDLSSPSPLSTSPPVFNEKDFDSSSSMSYHGVQWCPSRSVDSGLWAFIGDQFIRGHKDGSLIIAQHSEMIQRETIRSDRFIDPFYYPIVI